MFCDVNATRYRTG